MKKSLIALAVAGALTAPMVAQADATLYGSLRVQATSADNSDFTIEDNTSRIGIKATSELFSGATAIAHYETKASTETGALSGRLAYVGATGDMGTVTVGRQWIPAYLFTIAKTDIMAAASTETTHNYDFAARQGNVAAYVSPSMAGFQVAAAVVARNTGTINTGDTGEDVDAYHLAANYTFGDFYVGLSTLQYQGDDASVSFSNGTDTYNVNLDNSINSLAVAYSAGDVYVALSVEDDEVTREDGDAVVVLAGSYTMGNTTFLGSYTDFGDDADDNDDGARYIVEVQQKLGKQAFVFANYIEADSDAETVYATTNASGSARAADTFAVGYNVSF